MVKLRISISLPYVFVLLLSLLSLFTYGSNAFTTAGPLVMTSLARRQNIGNRCGRADGVLHTNMKGGIRHDDDNGNSDSATDYKECKNSNSSISRRSIVVSSFRAGIIGMTTSISATTLVIQPDRAFAKDELFKSNPLTNRALEQIRIWEQAEADTVQYDGVLAPGDAGNRGKTDAYPRLLVPILVMDEELTHLSTLIQERGKDNSNQNNNWRKLALDVINQPKYDKKEFKKTFNAFADNIYYGDPDRANVYLGGGATPKTEQSLAYLQRNEILTNIEDLRAELEFLMKNPTEGEDDVVQFSKNIVSGMKSYLDLVPPTELKAARELFLARQ